MVRESHVKLFWRAKLRMVQMNGQISSEKERYKQWSPQIREYFVGCQFSLRIA